MLEKELKKGNFERNLDNNEDALQVGGPQGYRVCNARRYKNVDQVLPDNKGQGERRQGFTLVELLVVVLIIGILAAVALPQYQKAVWKSRNAELKQLVKVIAQAEQVYYLANGRYAANFNKLDLDLPLEKPVTRGTESSYSILSNVCKIATMGSDAIRRGKNFDVVLNSTNLENSFAVVAVWTDGSYKCAGFRFNPKSGVQTCFETGNGTYTNSNGAFCEKVEGATLIPGTGSIAHARSYTW